MPLLTMRSVLPRYKNPLLCITFILLALTGCNNTVDEFPAKAPRPVTTFRLVKSTPQSPSQVTGSVESWKTEQIGFEIPGKLEWVLEPGKNIEPQVSDSAGAELKPGTPLAQIDATQFDVAVRNAKASVDVAKRNLEVAQISLNDSIPEQFKSAQADLDFAKAEYERYQKLVGENAVSQTATDQTKNRYEVQVARMTNLLSSRKQAEAEVQAADARLRSAGLSLENAERDLKNTTLYASFGGQIESVDVVPGSIVSAGSPIMKLQMMNPIKIDIEVSAQQSRQLQRNRQAAISYEMPDGGKQTSRGMLYQVNPSADASTRTFTATFLIFNEQRRPELPESLKARPLARTSEFWPLKVNEIIKSRPGTFMIEEGAIESEGEQSWVWMAKDIVRGDPLPPFLTVEKKMVTQGATRIPFLGNWVFREVTFTDQAVNSENMIVGSLQFPDMPREKWDERSVFIDSGQQWILRPGDLVTVELNPEMSEPGFYIPVDAIYEDRGATYVFVAADNKVTQREVRVVLPDKLDAGSLLRIQPLPGQPAFEEGMELVLGGVHYLNDGDAVRIVETKTSVGDQP